MAWNPSPTVAAARDFGLKNGADRVVIVYVLPDGRVGYASWGKTKKLCDETKCMADSLAEMAESRIMDGR